MSAVEWFARLRSGDGLKPDWSGVMQIANGLLAAGIPETTITSYLLEPSNEGVRFVNFDSKGHARPLATRERFVRDALKKARSRQAASPTFKDRGAVLEHIVKLREASGHDPSRWKGRGGATDRAILLAAFGVAERFGQLQFTASVRELADGANVGVKGAHNALRRLNDWIDIVEVGVGTRGSTLRLRGGDGNPLCPCKTDHEGCHGLLSDSDVWRWEGLGKSTARVFDLLSYEPRRSEDIAAALILSSRTVRGHLSKLKGHGLAAIEPDGWVRGHADLKSVAKDLGIENRGADQRAAHKVRAQRRREYLNSRVRRPRQRKEPRHRFIRVAFSPNVTVYRNRKGLAHAA